MDKKIKHLEFIQGVINRLSSDSFRMKGWCVVLVAALFILLARQGQVEFIAVALIPVIAFWGLDGYFLWQERLYRALYDHVRVLKEHEIDFSMNVSTFKTGPVWDWLGATFSRTVFIFYGALAIAVAVGFTLAINQSNSGELP